MLFQESIKDIEEAILSCKKCPLYKSRTNPVPGEGKFRKRILIIGEAPGKNEDLMGRPFVGKAGKLLDELLAKIGLSREDVYITNVVKCRPPNNREPNKDEINACRTYLIRQINALNPKLIVCLGRVSSNVIAQMLGTPFSSMTKDHGKLKKSPIRPIYVYFTYHPAAALYNRVKLNELEEDFLILKKLILELSEQENKK